MQVTSGLHRTMCIRLCSFGRIRILYKLEHRLHSMYYKPMGDLPYISSEQGGGLIIRTELYHI